MLLHFTENRKKLAGVGSGRFCGDGLWMAGLYPCNQGRVLIIDNELHPDVLTWRLNQVLVERGVTQERLRDRQFIFSQRGRLQDINFMGTYMDRLAKGNFKMIVVDAFYRVMPKNMDENDNGTIASVYNLIDRYVGMTGAAFVLIHHTTKNIKKFKESLWFCEF